VEVIKKNIPMKDVGKVMREVGYNTKEPNKHSSVADQIAEAEARPKKTMDDAINAAIAKIAPSRDSVVLPKPSSVKEVKKPVKPVPKPVVVKKEPEIEIDDIEVPKVEVPKVEEMKTILIDMSTLRTDVTFTGTGWCIRDIKIAYMAMVKGINIKIRDEYRKGNK